MCFLNNTKFLNKTGLVCAMCNDVAMKISHEEEEHIESLPLCIASRSTTSRQMQNVRAEEKSPAFF